MLFSGVSFAQQWQSIAPMHFAREEAAAVTLLDGQVLVAGGNDGTNALSSCELYDPNTNTWTMTGSMAEPRWRYPMVRLLDGKVFAAGGITGQVTDNTVSTTAGCEIYDPKTGQWQSVAQMSEASENFPLLVLPNGKVFLNGGLDANIGKYVALSEFFDPKTNSIQELAPMLIPYFGQIPFYDSIHNQILIQGGSNGGLQGLLLNTTQVYDIASNTWSYGPASLAEHDSYSYTVMPDNSLLCLGGRKTSYEAHDTIEVLKPPYKNWQFLGHLTSPRWHGAIVRVNDDSVLVIGGDNDPGVNSNVYDSTNWFVYGTDKTIQGPRMLQKRSVFVSAVTQLSGGCLDSTIVLTFGGLSADHRVLNSCEKLVVSNSVLSPNSQRLHRESGSAYFGAVDTLPLAVDISSAINLDSLWPYLTAITATYAWDSSVVSYAAYQPPVGWTLTSLASHGNSVDIGIQNGTTTASQPLDLGTALFRPRTDQLATSWVTLPILVMQIGGQPISLCVTDNEDSHWSVKTLGAMSGVAPQWAPTTRDLAIYPNPAGDELSIENSSADMAAVTIYDAIGRVVARASVAAGVTGTLDVHSLAPGVYFVRIISGSVTCSQTIVKK